MGYMEERRMRKLDLLPKLPTRKEKKPLKKVSDKKKQELAENTKEGKENALDKFYESQRSRMVGVCQCGCSKKTQKKDDTFYRYCICHIFPKKIFKSIETHPLNWVERTFWEGHHTNFDEQGMDRWPLMADWDDIKEKFFQLAPLLTEQEKSTKFYNNFENIIYKNK